MIYYIILTVIFCTGIVEIYADKHQKIGLYSFLYMMFILFAGFKLNVGTDYLSYKENFETAQQNNYHPVYAIEPLFWYWMQLFGMASIGFVGFWAITTTINIALKLYSFHQLSPYLAPSLLIYFVGLFFERDFDGLRQGLAISFCFLALMPLLSRSYSRYYLLIGIAIFIHYTSFIFLFLPFIANVRIQLKWIIAALLVGVCMAILKLDLIQTLLKVMPPSFLTAKIEAYISLNDDKYLKATGLSVGILFRIIILVLFCLYGEKLVPDARRFNLLKNGFFIGIMFSLVFNSIDILSHRLAYGFREFQIFILPTFMLISKRNEVKILILLILFLYSMLLLHRLLTTADLKQYYEYHNYFFSF